ncbi:MAG: uridine kinase [bacterium]
MKPILITIAGGSASGKTTVVEKIVSRLPQLDVSLLKHDDYYCDLSHMKLEDRYAVNYDHPSALDNSLLITHLVKLLSNESIDKPTYDFIEHNRSKVTERVVPTKVIILEGILVLENIDIRNLSHIKIFVESDDDIRFIRRLVRDTNTRGRSQESVINQYLKTVKPMHYKYVKPSKRFADIIIPNDNKHDVAVDIIITKIKSIINGGYL